MNETFEVSNISIIENTLTTVLSTEDSQYVTILNNDIISINIQLNEIDVNFIDVGIQGPAGKAGKSIQYKWDGTRLGIKTDNEEEFEYSNLKGEKGDKGEQGDNLTFDILTETQKQELRADVGDTSINYTNIFLNTLLN